MTQTASHASPAAGQGAVVVRRFLNGFLVASVAALLMTVTGALNTGQIGFGPRFAYWMIVMQMGSLIGVAVNSGIRQWGRFAERQFIEAIIVASLIAFPLTLIVTGASMIFFKTVSPGLTGMFLIFAIVAFISLIMTGINYLLPTQPGATPPAALAETLRSPEPEPEPVQPVSPRFAERLPIGLQSAQILALSAEDHYLRVHTEAGDALILMRLSDAVAELASAEGLQTHRSWWVAKAAVKSGKRTDGKGTLTLSNGVEAPVSRSYLKAVGAAGWFA